MQEYIKVIEPVWVSDHTLLTAYTEYLSYVTKPTIKWIGHTIK